MEQLTGARPETFALPPPEDIPERILWRRIKRFVATAWPAIKVTLAGTGIVMGLLMISTKDHQDIANTFHSQWTVEKAVIRLPTGEEAPWAKKEAHYYSYFYVANARPFGPGRMVYIQQAGKTDCSSASDNDHNGVVCMIFYVKRQ